MDDPLDGFTFVLSEREEDAMNQVRVQYFQPLVCGYGENYEQELEIVIEHMYDAGFDRYLAAIQEQLTECSEGNVDAESAVQKN